MAWAWLRATYRPSRGVLQSVAVKVLKAAGAPADALASLESEAALLQTAFDAGANEYVVKMLGLVKGGEPSPQEWRAALGGTCTSASAASRARCTPLL